MTRNQGVGLLLLAFFLGILLGLGLGWQVWPVKWYNTDPADLRTQHQEEWVLMTADSLAVNSNGELASNRLAQLIDDNTSWEQVSALVHQVAKRQRSAGDGGSATRLERLVTITGLPAAGTTEFTPPRRTLVQSISWLGYVILGLGFLIMASALVVLVLARRRQANPMPAPADALASADAPVADPAPAGRMEPVVNTPAGTRRLWGSDDFRGTALQGRPTQDGGGTPPYNRADAYAGAARTGRPVNVMPVFSEDEEDSETEPEGVGQRPAAVAGATGLFLGTYRAEYTLGDDHFEENFAISAGDDFLGDCGIVIADVMDEEGVQRVDAFEMWLHEVGKSKSDAQESRCLLISEYVGQAEGFRDRLAARGQVFAARPNLSITLETDSLRMLATVIGIAYAGDEPMPNSYFSRLTVEFRVERKRAV